MHTLLEDPVLEQSVGESYAKVCKARTKNYPPKRQSIHLDAWSQSNSCTGVCALQATGVVLTDVVNGLASFTGVRVRGAAGSNFTMSFSALTRYRALTPLETVSHDVQTQQRLDRLHTEKLFQATTS